MRLVIGLLVIAAVALLALLVWAAVLRRRRAEAMRRLPARWTVEIEERPGVDERGVFTEGVIYLTMPNGEVLERHVVTSTLLTAEDENYIPRVDAMRQQSQDEADTRNRRLMVIEEQSRAAGRPVMIPPRGGL